MLIRLVHEVSVVALHTLDKFFLYCFNVKDVVEAGAFPLLRSSLFGFDLRESLEGTWRELELAEVWEVQTSPHFII